MHALEVAFHAIEQHGLRAALEGLGEEMAPGLQHCEGKSERTSTRSSCDVVGRTVPDGGQAMSEMTSRAPGPPVASISLGGAFVEKIELQDGGPGHWRHFQIIDADDADVLSVRTVPFDADLRPAARCPRRRSITIEPLCSSDSGRQFP